MIVDPEALGGDILGRADLTIRCLSLRPHIMLTPDDLLRDPIGNYPAATVACFDATSGELPRGSWMKRGTRGFWNGSRNWARRRC